MKHLKAVALSLAPQVAQALLAKGTKTSHAALFGMLTATRVSEFIGARWSEINFDEKVWSVPPERRKDGVPFPHRVPLSCQAIALLKEQKQKSDLIFPG